MSNESNEKMDWLIFANLLQVILLSMILISVCR